MRKFVSFSTLFGVLIVSLAFAQIPQTMSYQGVLTGADGNPVADGTVSLTFKLYDVAADGAALWEETQSLDVKGGIFNAILGSVTTLNLPFDKQYWLGITIGQDAELTPRIALTASPYSLGATATVTQPAAGQSFVVRDATGNTTHVLSANGDVRHTGVGTFLGGIAVGDTVIVPEDTSATAATTAAFSKDGTTLETTTTFPAVGFSAFGTKVGVLGSSPRIAIQGQTGSGLAIFGKSVSGTAIFGRTRTGSGVQGRSSSGLGVWGISESGTGARGESQGGVGIFGFSADTAGVRGLSFKGPGILGQSLGGPAGKFLGDVVIESNGKLKIDNVPAEDSDKFLVWGADKFVKMRSLPGTAGFDGTLVGKPFNLVNANGDTVFSVQTDGTSVHKGRETFLGGITLTDANNGPGMFIGQRSIIMFDNNGGGSAALDGDSGFSFFKPVMVWGDTLSVKDAQGNIVTMFAPDGTSLHKGDETFEGDVILKGTNGKGIKLVDAAGTTLAGFGRMDLDTGQLIGVFAKAPSPGGLAGAFEGPVDVLGEITASSLHIVNTNGDTLTKFNADGTSFHKGKETFAGGIDLVNSDGTKAISMMIDANPNNEYTLKVNGNLDVSGILAAGTKQFKIDHPLDPEHKYLTHTSVESPDMKTVYDGVVSLDENGAAVVEMPDWFQALNGDFRYQLTAIGAPAPDLYIAEEIQNNRFRIAGGTPGMKVSWQVTGIRHDAWAQEHRQPIEGYK